MTRDIDYSKRDPVAVDGDLCAACNGGNHGGHVAALGSICIGCACGWKPAAPEVDDAESAPAPVRVRAVDGYDASGAIQPPGLHHLVLACGNCGRAIEGFEHGVMGIDGRRNLYAEPCGHEACEVPVWAMNAATARGAGDKKARRA